MAYKTISANPVLSGDYVCISQEEVKENDGAPDTVIRRIVLLDSSLKEVSQFPGDAAGKERLESALKALAEGGAVPAAPNPPKK